MSFSWPCGGVHRQENKCFGKVARFMQTTKAVHSYNSCKHTGRGLMERARNATEYDLYSAITFLLVGLGIGSLLAIVFNPQQRVMTVDSRGKPGLEQRESAGKRVA
jgi:hypothetical protein